MIVTQPASPLGKLEKLVTVVVACAGQLEFTKLCVVSLLRFSRAPVELIFLDADSLDGTREYLDGIATAAPLKIEIVNVPLAGHEPRDRESRGRKEELPVRGEYLALLDNDTIVTQGWLEALTAALAQDSTVGLAAPLSNITAADLRLGADAEAIDLDEPVAETGRAAAVAMVDKVNRFARERLEKRQLRGQPSWSAVEEVGGGCAVLRREAINRLGGFPTRTALGVFDIAGLGAKLRQNGFKLLNGAFQVARPDVLHGQSITSERVRRIGGHHLAQSI